MLNDRVGSPGQKPLGQIGSRVKNPDPFHLCYQLSK